MSQAENNVRPWYLGVATGIGSMPGVDPIESAKIIAGELPDLPYLAELPARGVGADMVGRTAGLLVDVYAEVVPSGWRIARRPTRDQRRAKDFLSWDLDSAEQHYGGADQLKVQICGPWTLAAMMEVPSGHRALVDHGAVDDLTASLAEGLALHIADLRRRLPGTEVVVQIDEPALPAVLAGSLPTASGFGTVRSVAHHRAGEVLKQLKAAAGERAIIHCCHAEAPLRLFRESGFRLLSTDFTLIGTETAALDAIGELVEDGVIMMAGIIPSTQPTGARGAMPDPDRPAEHPERAAESASGSLKEWARPVVEPLSNLGFSALTMAEQVIPTPTCGLAGASVGWARRALSLSRDVARLIGEPLI